MPHLDKPHSHPICPTCEADLTGRENLSYFGNAGNSPCTNDDAYRLHEETTTLLYFLSAVAQAAPLAVAQYTENAHMSPDWADDLRRLAEELTGETKRRLGLFYEAALIWKERVGGKEG